LLLGFELPVLEFRAGGAELLVGKLLSRPLHRLRVVCGHVLHLSSLRGQVRLIGFQRRGQIFRQALLRYLLQLRRQLDRNAVSLCLDFRCGLPLCGEPFLDGEHLLLITLHRCGLCGAQLARGRGGLLSGGGSRFGVLRDEAGGHGEKSQGGGGKKLQFHRCEVVLD
jgi:hypothetical protein